MRKRDPQARFRSSWVVVTVFVGIAAIWWMAHHVAIGFRSKRLSFNETIQPILSENCYACHGPDPGARKAGLRLDRGEFAFAPHQDSHEKYGPAIIPGNPDKSPLVHRTETKNAKDRMPPPEAHKTLKPEQIALLREWVKQGAEYEELWSFVP